MYNLFPKKEWGEKGKKLTFQRLQMGRYSLVTNKTGGKRIRA